MINKTSLISVVAMAAMVSATAHAQPGRDGHLNILYWQASSTVNPYLSGGTKDIEAASLVLEPLAHYDENGNMVPVLVEAIPTVENGAWPRICAASPGSSRKASSGPTAPRSPRTTWCSPASTA